MVPLVFLIPPTQKHLMVSDSNLLDCNSKHTKIQFLKIKSSYKDTQALPIREHFLSKRTCSLEGHGLYGDTFSFFRNISFL